MTITNRNRILTAIVILSTALAAAVLTGAVLLFVSGNLPHTAPGPRWPAFIDSLGIFSYSFVAVILSIVILSLFTPLSVFFVSWQFEKTQAVEITFFVGFLASCQFEGLRILMPLFNLQAGYSSLFLFVCRAVFLGRLLAPLCFLFAAIFSTSGMFQQADRNIYLLIAASLLFAGAIPLNTTEITSTYMVTYGYSSSFFIARILFSVATVVTFFVTGRYRGIKEYERAAGASILLFSGYGLLVAADNFIFLIAGSVLLGLGTWLFVKNIHAYYLWQ